MEIRLLGPGDAGVLENVADGVFDFAVRTAFTDEFLSDPRHHLCVAIDNGVVVGFGSAVHYIHPDKPPQLWINEVGVAPTHHGRGIGNRIIACLLEHGVSIGCRTAWVVTEAGNAAARALYVSAGGRLDVELEDPDGQPVLYLFSEDA